MAKKSTALVRYRTRTVTRYRSRRRRRIGRRVVAAGPGLAAVGVGALALGYLGERNSTVSAFARNIPGAATVGAPAMLGLACLLGSKVASGKLRRYLRAAGIAGVVLAAVEVGRKGTDMAWVGDEQSGFQPVEGDEETADVGEDDYEG